MKILRKLRVNIKLVTGAPMSQPVLTQMRSGKSAHGQLHQGHKDKGLEYPSGEPGPPKAIPGEILVRDLQIQLAGVFRGGCRGDSGMDSGTVAETKIPGTSMPMEAGTVKGAVKKKG